MLKEPHSEWKEQAPLEWPPETGHKAARMWRHKDRPLFVMRSLSATKDEKWIHVSISRLDRIPSWEEICHVRDCFLGKEIEAYQVLPKHSEYVNLADKCLHIWAPLDGERRVANLHDLINEEAS